MENRANAILLSAISVYEIEFKRDRDPVLANLPRNLADAALERGFSLLSITPAHAARAGQLPRLHGDPFDRLLIAQSFEEGAALVTADRAIMAYGATTLW